MTTDDIKYAQVTLISKDGRCFVGEINPVLPLVSLSTIKFVELDSDKVAEVKLSDYAKKGEKP